MNMTERFRRKVRIVLSDVLYNLKGTETSPPSPDGAETEACTVSFVMPVYNTKPSILAKAIMSVRNQTSRAWELILVDDCSTRASTKKVLTSKLVQDAAIRVIIQERNGGISVATNAGIEVARGTYFAFLDHDDELDKNAVAWILETAKKHPEADFIYSDEDKITGFGFKYARYHKPDWSPDLLLNRMYTCHLGVYRTALLKITGALDSRFDGSQDYDLALRVAEKTSNIVHIPEVLYHWRSLDTSTASSSKAKSYAHFAGKAALQASLDRRGEGGIAEELTGHAGYFHVAYPVPADTWVSIIILSWDQADLLKTCVTSLVSLTGMQQFEIIIVNNRSIQAGTEQEYRALRDLDPEKISILDDDRDFNFSGLCNAGARRARGDLLLFLNNDTQIIQKDWLSRMSGFAQRKNTGAVGAMLVYPDTTIQHAGIALGVMGIANHPHHGYPASHSGENIGQLLSQNNCSAVTGACLMAKTGDFWSVGGFDENLAVAYNDIDLCLKLHEKGRYNVILPDVRLIHYESRSRGADLSGTKKNRLEKESAIMLERWGSFIRNDPFYNPNLTRTRLDCSPAFPRRSHE